jgi:beta-glucosidase
MKKQTITLYAFALVAGISLVQCTKKTPQLGKDPVDKIIAAMTLEEKAYYVTGTGMNFPGVKMNKDTTSTPGAPVIGTTQSLVPGAAGTTYEIARLGIPPMVVADGPAGLRISPKREKDNTTYYCTAFPIATLLASTWDTAVVYQVGQAMGNDVLEYGADVILGPGMNIQRNPLCGRNFEYYSEDPLVTGKMASAMVQGIQSQGVGTSIKHFAANNAETNRNSLNTIVSERALREVYLEGFRIAVQQAHPWTVMSSYNLIDNVYTSESPELLTNILRNDWGYKGMVMTDWFGGQHPVEQMIAGNDLLMPGTPQQAKAILTAVKEGKLEVAVLDRNIARILNTVLESPRYKSYKFSGKPDLSAHAIIARKAAAEGMVLLKNNNSALPLIKSAQPVAAFGDAVYETIIGGTGSGDVNEPYIVSIADGLTGAGFKLDEELKSTYQSYIKKTRETQPPSKNPFLAFLGEKEPIPEMNVDAALVNKMASSSEVAIITIGRNSGEGSDRQVDNDFNLTAVEKNMISTITKAFHAKGKKAIVILNVGGVIETASWRDIPDAILLAWQAGEETGNSVADVVSGKVNPSGKLACSFPMQYKDVPSSGTFPGVVTEVEPARDTTKKADMMDFMRSHPAKVVYEEGIYVGYRYYGSFGIKPAYEFGYGLSYTQFEYSNLKLSSDKFDNQIIATVDVKNTGSVTGKEVVQLYLSAPVKELDKPAYELKGFAKTSLLLPGDKQTMTFRLDTRNLASFNTASSSWVADAGQYEVRIGASSSDIRQKASFTLNEDRIVKKESKALVPSENIKELKSARK